MRPGLEKGLETDAKETDYTESYEKRVLARMRARAAERRQAA